MSKYTTEVRFICESKSGLDISGGCDDVDEIIGASWDKIFTTKCDFFDERYRKILCCKILKHYYLREICCETVGIWKLWMNTRLEEIMPYYNQLYESELLEFNPLYDVDITRMHNRTDESTSTTKTDSTQNVGNEENETGNRGTKYTDNTDATNNSKNLFSDTPQGGLDGIESNNYLTDARLITESGATDKTGNNDENYNNNRTTNGTSTSNANTDNNINSTEDFLESVKGKQGTESYSSLLNKYRQTFLNIDMEIIDRFSDLFFGLW